MNLSRDELEILRALAGGHVVKAHRDLEGSRVYRLHPLGGEPEIISAAAVRKLEHRRLIDSNKKFPAASFLLTEKGREVAVGLLGGDVAALGAENYVQE